MSTKKSHRFTRELLIDQLGTVQHTLSRTINKTGLLL